MLLRNSREPIYGQPAENCFVAVDKRTGEELGICVLFEETNPGLFPRRPVQIRLHFEGDADALNQLIGAGIARARALCAAKKEPARIYIQCLPEDEDLIDMLRPFGFQDNDGLVRMSLKLPSEVETRLPAGCVVVEDDLSDPLERKYFLDRYNALFMTESDLKWLDEVSRMKNFTRLLSVSPNGLVGEVLFHTEDGIGKVDFIQTSRRWRNMGVAAHMLCLAGDKLTKLGFYRLEADVRARMPWLLRTFEHAGFAQSRLVMRYPGIDVNP